MLHIHLASRFTQALADWFNLRDILKEFPTDPASLFVLGFIGVSLGMLVWFGRPRKKTH